MIAKALEIVGTNEDRSLPWLCPTQLHSPSTLLSVPRDTAAQFSVELSLIIKRNRNEIRAGDAPDTGEI